MKIKVLGCSGAEYPGHHLSGFLLDGKILFDAGSLTNVLDKKNQLKIEHVFITHPHLDHILGILLLADNIIYGKIRRKVNIISIHSVVKAIKKNLLNGVVWPNFTIIPNARNGILNFTTIKLGQSVKINDYSIVPYQVNHSVPAVGYLVEDKRGKRFFYTGDTGPSDNVWEKLREKLREKRIHCLIIEVSLPNKMEEIAIKIGHLTPWLLKKEILKIKNKPEKIYITHLKPRYLEIISTELQRLKMDNIKLLRDGEIVEI
jgi:ribonuclease BN (tRNA processing enzyme)